MRYLIDSLDPGASATVLALLHLAVLGLVLLRTYRAATDHQTPRRSGPVTMVTNGVSETQWRDGWAHQLLSWAAVFSVPFGIGYVLLLILATSRWLPAHPWVGPLGGCLLLSAGVGAFGWWLWSRRERPLPIEPVPPPFHPSWQDEQPKRYEEPYGSWGPDEGI